MMSSPTPSLFEPVDSRVAWFRRPIAMLMALLIAVAGMSLGSIGSTASADDSYPASLSLAKTASSASVQPGDEFTYTLQPTCSSTVSGCVNAVLTDTIPAPFEVISEQNPIISGAQATTNITGNTVTVTFTDSVQNSGGKKGLAAGTAPTVTVKVRVPQNLDRQTWDGKLTTNTATIVSDTAAQKQASADVAVSVPAVPSVATTKTWDTATADFAPGQSSTVTLSVQNTSNDSASELRVIDPADASQKNPFDYYDFGGISSLTYPTGADQATIVLYRGADQHAYGPFSSASSVSFGSDSLTDVTGVEVVYASSSGATITAGGSPGSAQVALTQRAVDRTTGTALGAGTDQQRKNTARGTVTVNGNTASSDAEASQQVTPQNIAVTADKTITGENGRTTIPAGDTALVEIGGTNTGNTTLTTLTLDEPSSTGSAFGAGLANGDLTITGFDSAKSAWPAGATSATITWKVSSGTAPAPTAFVQGATPVVPQLAVGQQLIGFTVTYQGAIAKGARAGLGIDIISKSDLVVGVAGSKSFPNTLAVIGAKGEKTATATKDATLVVVNPTIDVELTKTITPSTNAVIPGSTSVVQLKAQTVQHDGSVKPHDIVISDPDFSSTSSPAYWDAFDATAIAPTTVPANSTLTVEARANDGTWYTVGTKSTGNTAETYSASLASFIGSYGRATGLRFTFHNDNGFAEATTVKPAISFTARETLASDNAVKTYPVGEDGKSTDEATTYVNAATATAKGQDPSITDTDTSNAPVKVTGTDTGPGPIIVNKQWDNTSSCGTDQTHGKTLCTQSRATTGAMLTWGVKKPGATSVTVQDPSDAQSVVSGNTVDLSKSPFNVFDLKAIDKITTQTDPLIQWDQVSKVELYTWNSSNGEASWTDITSKFSASSLQGGFPGYTLTDAEQATTIGVRLTFTEWDGKRVNSTDPTAPAVGSGVASSSDGRKIHLQTTLRNDLRNTPANVDDPMDMANAPSSPGRNAWVTAKHTFNAQDPGLIDNAMQVKATFPGSTYEGSDSDQITLIDPTMNTTADKCVAGKCGDDASYDMLIPKSDVAADDYPTTTFSVSATNDSPVNTWHLWLVDPANDATHDGNIPDATYNASDNPFEYLNITKITAPTYSVNGTSTNASGAGVQETYDSSATLKGTFVELWKLVPDDDGGYVKNDDGTYQIVSAGKMSFAQAQQLSPEDLADVAQVFFEFQGKDAEGGTIKPGATVTANYEVQLRTSTRTGKVEAKDYSAGTVLTNSVRSTIHDEVIDPDNKTNSANANATITLQDGDLDVATRKTFSTDTQTRPQSASAAVTVNLTGYSTGSVAPSTMTLTDDTATFWNTMDLQADGIVIANMPEGADQVRVDAKVGADWYAGVAGGSDAAALPNGVNAADVVGLRFVFTRADGTAFIATDPGSSKPTVQLTVKVRDQQRDGSGAVSVQGGDTPNAGENAAGAITNSVVATAERPGKNAAQSLSAESGPVSAGFTLTAGTAAVQVQKTSIGQTTGGSTVPWTLKVKNVGTGYLTNPVVTDTVPAELLATQEAAVYETSIGGTLSTTEVSMKWAEDHRSVTFSWPDGAQMAPGEEFDITLKLKLQPGLAGDSVVQNTFGVSADQTLTQCGKLDANQAFDATYDSAGNTCSTSNTVTVASAGSFQVTKSVKTDDNSATNVTDPSAQDPSDTDPTFDGYYQYPWAADSKVGATDSWRVDLVNGGTVDANSLTVVDRLPRSGDTSLIGSYPRGSGFSPRFNGDISVTLDGQIVDPNAYSISYSSAVPSPGYTAGNTTDDSQWTAAAAFGDAAEATGFRIVFDPSKLSGGVIARGSTIRISYTSTNVPTTEEDDGLAPIAPSSSDSVAWNSTAIMPTYVNGTSPSAPIEGLKSGVTLHRGDLKVTKRVEGVLAAQAPDSFVAEVACTVPDGNGGSAAVPLGAQEQVTLTKASGYTATLSGIPVGASCTVQEQGDDGSYGESSRVVSYSQDSDHATIVGDGADTAEVSIVNAYDAGALSITKQVETMATVGEFGPFAFEVACKSPLGSVVEFSGSSRATFSLSSGETWTAPEGLIPVNSTCTITETDSGGADASAFTGTNVTADADGHSASVLIANDSTDVTSTVVTNRFDAGTLTVRKVVDGDGAAQYGQGDFSLHAVCTYGEGQSLLDEEFLLSAGETKTFGVFPVGTSCAVTENASGGATSTAISPNDGTVVIGHPDGVAVISTAEVDVTNTFDTGSIAIVKNRIGEGVAERGDGPFTATAVCTYVRDGEVAPIELPNDGVVTLDRTNDYRAEIDGIIDGAECVIEETDTGGADRTSMDPEDGRVQVAAGQTQTVTITNEFDAAPRESDSDEQLARTGLELSILIGGFALLVGGAAATMLSGGRRSRGRRSL